MNNSSIEIRNRVAPELSQVPLKSDSKVNIYTQAYGDFPEKRGNSASAWPEKDTICVNEKFWKIDQDACAFAVKHEIGHLMDRKWVNYHNKAFSLFVGAVTHHFFQFCIKQRSMRAIPLAVIDVALISLVNICYKRTQEQRADTFAIKNSTNDELKGGMRCFKSGLEANLICKGAFPFWKSLILSNGEVLENLLSHPSSMSRIKRIEKELESRGTDSSFNADDQQKINDLKCWNLWERFVDSAETKAKHPFFRDFARRHDLE